MYSGNLRNDKRAGADRRRSRSRMRWKLRAGILLIAFFVLGGCLFMVCRFRNVQSGMGFLKNMESISRKEANAIVQNQEQYPAALLAALQNNEELADFVLGYPEKHGTYADPIEINLAQETDVMSDSRAIPLFLQWDERWGYADYGDSIIGLAGCGPTCLSMVLVGLTGDTSMNPKWLADFSSRNGYVTEAGTQWALMSTGAGALGLSVREVPLQEDKMAEELEAGNPIICSMRPGDFTTTGHFIVLAGYEDGYFVVNDPNSRKRSERKWTYGELSGQIKAMWAFAHR